MRAVLTLVLFVLAVTGAAQSQSGNLSAPALGYVHDKEGRALRPILGIPGAATIGDTIRLPFAITLAAIAPGLDCALARIEDTSKLVLVRNLSGEISWSEIDGIRAEADRIVLSHSGRSAAAYGATAGVVHVISGLPDNPAVTRTVDVTGSQVRAVALSDDGRLLAVAFASESGDSLRVNDGENGGWKDLGPGGRVRSMAFAPNGRDLAVSAEGPAAASIIRDVGTTAESRLLMGEADGLASPAAVHFATDSRLLIAAARAIIVVELGGGARFELNCACTPTTLEELDGSTFRLTDFSQGPIWLLHNSDDGARLLFVPPPVPVAAAEVPVQ